MPARIAAAALKWSGPILAGLGLSGIAAIALLPALKENPLDRWILTETLAPARMLPLIGLGAAFALIGRRALSAGIILFGLGIAGGLIAEDGLLRILDMVPQAATHLFLAGPISYLAAGAAVIFGERLRTYLAPIAALILGAMLALAIKLTDPSLHEPAFTWTPVLIACWVVAAVAVTLRAFRRGWFSIFGRILGSWLVAIGLLYGGASLMPRIKPPPPPTNTMQGSTRGAEMNQTIPGLPVPQQPGFLPGGIERPPQP